MHTKKAKTNEFEQRKKIMFLKGELNPYPLCSSLKTVPVIFVVDTVVSYYCIYYENYWNSLYSGLNQIIDVKHSAN